MAFGPRSALASRVDAATQRVGLPVTTSGHPDGLLVRPRATPGEGFQLTVLTEALGARVALDAEPLAAAYSRSLSEQFEAEELEHLESTLRASVDGVHAFTINRSTVNIVVSLRPSSSGGDLDRLEELLVVLLGVASRPYERFDFPGYFLPARRRPMVALGAEAVDQVYDPVLQRKSTNEHRDTENSVIAELLARGLRPFNGSGTIQFDLGWRAHDGGLWVCEVKSTACSEQEQFRLGLGQVIEYRHRLNEQTPERWNAILVLSRSCVEPKNQEIAASVGVALVDGPPFDLPDEPAEWSDGV